MGAEPEDSPPGAPAEPREEQRAFACRDWLKALEEQQSLLVQDLVQLLKDRLRAQRELLQLPPALPMSPGLLDEPSDGIASKWSGPEVVSNPWLPPPKPGGGRGIKPAEIIGPDEALVDLVQCPNATGDVAQTLAFTGEAKAEMKRQEELDTQLRATILHSSTRRLPEEREDLVASVKETARGLGGCLRTMKDALLKPAKEAEVKTYKSNALRELAGQDAKMATSRLEALVASNRFELVTGCIILSCATMMALDIEYHGKTVGHNLQQAGFASTGQESWPAYAEFSAGLELFYCGAFTVELLVRMVALRWRALLSGWTWLDGTLVAFSWLEVFSTLALPMDPKVLRIARLARIARLVKMLKAMRLFDTLVLLLHSVHASIAALVWSFVLILLVEAIVGITMCQLLYEYIVDPEKPLAIREEIFQYFGTFMNCIVTMFEISMGNWVIPCRLLYDHVSPLWGVWFVLFRCCFLFAMFKVITAVFIAETARHVKLDDNITIGKAQRERESFCKKLHAIFLELDDDDDGMLSWREFEQLISDDLLRAWLTSLEIDTHDLQQLFVLLDQGDMKISVHEFIRGMTRIKGPAKSIDVLKIQAQGTKIEAKLRTVNQLFAKGGKMDFLNGAAADLVSKVERLGHRFGELEGRLRRSDPEALRSPRPRPAVELGKSSQSPLGTFPLVYSL